MATAFGAHREGDLRSCGAVTVSLIPENVLVYVNGQRFAIDGDPNSHGAGALIASTNNVFINGTRVVNNFDLAAADAFCPTLNAEHCHPEAVQASLDVFVGEPLDWNYM
ncbi:MAG: hypothetical protein QF535_11375 [Anaerolineales bacterium]|jgi:hypothetical protein|nr:hypothetical protein [Anaerolineales bacterium]|tara:strand:- start:11 stop:337 length:327 start_codon:yes stop_codon:yes gene_type:complete